MRLHRFLSRRRGAGKGPHLERHDVVSTRISRSLDGVRIGQLSDIHVRTGVKPKTLHKAVEMLNELRPDLVVLTGDYVCVSVRPLAELTAALKELTVPTYATLGNHDHWSCARTVTAALEAANVDVLRNEHRAVRAKAGVLHLVGIDDCITGHHDPDAAFSGVPDDATKVVLSHDPKSADFLHPYRPALILSGHTHGGQVFFEKLTPLLARRIGMKYLHGFFDVEGALLYVNRGLGATVPVRYRSPVEVACLTLKSLALT